MPAGHGLRSRIMALFTRGFRKKGTIHSSAYLRTYHVGDYGDIKVNGAVHKGMPHKFYHGQSGMERHQARHQCRNEQAAMVVAITTPFQAKIDDMMELLQYYGAILADKRNGYERDWR
ncbi:hypothetical protein L2E82_14532 [Cichorium intybus]|uniref:Uncharacterized protein n=1 Tax=Cichorium intybus TaxID=13427 RepID=A0ACB9F0M0_CICIN|nr:hypothetical protein L2E82_14532 [Cichorium intybus]